MAALVVRLLHRLCSAAQPLENAARSSASDGVKKS